VARILLCKRREFGGKIYYGCFFYWRTCVLVLVQLSVTVVTEQSAYQMASQMTVDRTNAIHKILDDVYAHNRDNSDAVSSICTLFTELSHYGYLHILLFILT